MQKIINKILAIGLIGLAIALVIVSNKTLLVQGAAPSGLPSTVATSSFYAITSTQSRLFATSTACASRIISTAGGGGILLTFADDDIPTSSYGHWQGASTTVAYDSGLYGCGAVRGYSSVSQTITLTETR